MKKLEIKIKIIPDNAYYGFGAFLEAPKKNIKEEPLILINFQAHLFASAEFNIDFYELLSESTVHEMLHQIQGIYKRKFKEKEVRHAIDQAKEYIAKNKIKHLGRGNKKAKEKYQEDLYKRLEEPKIRTYEKKYLDSVYSENGTKLIKEI
jgi:hypothetical protein